ncbi:MAG: VWA-like domain-containing protein [Blastocatellia bacterium]
MINMPKELAAARFVAANKRPYLALALYALTPIKRIGLKTMAVDSKYRLYYDPIIFNQWNREQIAGVLIHEVSHVLRKHHLRGQKLQANPDLWNKANDAEINDDLISEGLALPGSPITPASLGFANGNLAEEYYFALLKQQQNNNIQQQNNTQQSNQNNQNNQSNQNNQNQSQQQQNNQQQSSGSKPQQQPSQASSSQQQQGQNQGQQAQAQSSKAQDPNASSNGQAQEQGKKQGSNNSDGQGQQSQGQGSQTPSIPITANSQNSQSSQNHNHSSTGKEVSLNDKEIPMPGAGRCGSCATGIKAEYEADESEAPGLSSIEQIALGEKVAKQILKASSNRGRVSAGWQRWANEKLHPKADWRRQLRSLISSSLRMKSGANDYSYSRPNRRQSVYGNILMPSLVEQVPNIAVIVDTSGSINDRLICQALAEVENILKSTGQKVHLISCDAKVHFSKQVSSIKGVKLLGGGGTNMKVGIKEALEAKLKPDVIIVITDGYTPWPSQVPKRTKIIAALTRPKMVPSWIRTVNLFD